MSYTFLKNKFALILLLHIGTVSFGQNSGNAAEFIGDQNNCLKIVNSHAAFYNDETFSVSFWTKLTDENPGFQELVASQGINNGSYTYAIRVRTDGKIDAHRWVSGTQEIVNSNDSLNDGSYHHVTYVKKSDTLKLYIDGNLNHQKLDQTILEQVIPSDTIYVGNRLLGGPFALKGEIDELAFFNISLDQSQIINIKERGVLHNHEGLVGLYHFDESSNSNIAYDSGPYAAHGTWLGNPSRYVPSEVTFQECNTPLEVRLTTDLCYENEGQCGDLRYAIHFLNNGLGGDTITFNIPGDNQDNDNNGITDDEPHTIHLQGALPPLFKTVLIDGTSQPGYRLNTDSTKYNGHKMIEINGGDGLEGSIASGFLVFASDVNLKGLVITGFTGTHIQGYEESLCISGCFIGTKTNGNAIHIPDLSSSTASGVEFNGRGRYSTIGGPNLDDLNLFSGLRSALIISETSDISVWNNFIGSNAAGDSVLGNLNTGIYITGSERVSVGNNNGSVNKIWGNTTGIVVSGYSGATDHIVLNNEIAFNRNDGLLIGAGHHVLISQNSIYNNDSSGIKIDYSSIYNIAPVPPTIAYNGPGNGISGHIRGSGTPGARIQLYADSAVEGQLFLDTISVDTSGEWTYNLSEAQFALMVDHGLSNLTALQDSANITSGFSAPLVMRPCKNPLLVTKNTDNHVTDKGECGDFRFAAAFADANLGPDTIRFDLDSMATPIILLKEAVDFYTYDWGDSTAILGDLSEDSLPQIWLRGGHSSTHHCLAFYSNNCTVQGLAVTNFGGGGININGNNTTIKQCNIGIKPNGHTIEPNGESDDFSNTAQILLSFDFTGSIIGGDSPSDRNIISTSSLALQDSPSGIPSAIRLNQVSEATIKNNLFIAPNLDGEEAAGIWVEDKLDTGLIEISRNSFSGFTHSVILDGMYQGTWIYQNSFKGSLNSSITYKYYSWQKGGPTIPVINQSSGYLSGQINGSGVPGELIQLYADAQDDGELFLDTTRVDSSGKWAYNISYSQKAEMLNRGLHNITALQDSALITSEFSSPLQTDWCLDPLTVILTTDNDPYGNGECGDVRYASNYAADDVNPSSISFNVQEMGSTRITLDTTLHIRGAGTTVTGNPSNDSIPEIWLTSKENGTYSGIKVGNAVLEGLIVTGFGGNGIIPYGNSWIKKCYIGIQDDGLSPDPNGDFGIYIEGGGGGDVIGGNANEGNLIFGGEKGGIHLFWSHSITVSNNTIMGGTGDTSAAISVNHTSPLLIQENELRSLAYGIRYTDLWQEGVNWIPSGFLDRNTIYGMDSSGIVMIHQQLSPSIPIIERTNSIGYISGRGIANERIQLYADSTNQGQFFLDTIVVLSDSTWSYQLNPSQIRVIQTNGLLNITALQDSANSTSEFSSPLTIDFGLDTLELKPISNSNWCLGATQEVAFRGTGTRFNTSANIQLIALSTSNTNDSIIIVSRIGSKYAEWDTISFLLDTAWPLGQYTIMLDVGYSSGPRIYDTVSFLTVPERPRIIGSDQGCHDQTSVYGYENNQADAHNWYVDGGVNHVTNGNFIWITPEYGDSFTLRLDATNICGHSDLDSIVVALDSLPSIDVLWGDSVFCLGSAIEANPITSLNTQSVSWEGPSYDSVSMNINGSYNIYASSGKNYLYGVSTNTCGQVRDSLLIEVQEPITSVIINGRQEVCANTQGAVYHPDSLLEGHSYSWNVLNGSTSGLLQDSVVVDFLTDNLTIELNVTNKCNSYTGQLIALVTNILNLEVEFSSDTICSGESANIRVQNFDNYTYSWFSIESEDTLSNTHSLSVNEEGAYYSIIKLDGCSGSSDTVNISVDSFTDTHDPLGNDYYVCEERDTIRIDMLDGFNPSHEVRLYASYLSDSLQLFTEIPLLDSIFIIDTTARYILRTNNGRCTDTDDIFIGINEGFILENDTLKIKHEQSEIDILNNDLILLDQNGFSITILESDPNKSTVSLSSNKNLIYHPNDNFSGYDTVTYLVFNNNCANDVSTAIVYLEVLPAANNEVLQINDDNNILDSIYISIDTFQLIANDRGSITHIDWVSESHLGGDLVEIEPGVYGVSYSNNTINNNVGQGSIPDSIIYFLCDTINCSRGVVSFDVEFPADSVVNIEKAFNAVVYGIVTPNGDGVNEFLRFKFYERNGLDSTEVFPKFNTLSIFTKWGDIVYDTRERNISNYSNSIDGGFDGTSDADQKLPSGTYYFVLEYGFDDNLTTENGTRPFTETGFFLLIR